MGQKLGPTSAAARPKLKQEVNVPHGLDGIRVDDLLVLFTFRLVVTAMMNELHLLENGRLCFGLSPRSLRGSVCQHTLPDSPAPSSNILISFFAMARSRFSWLSIWSLPGGGE